MSEMREFYFKDIEKSYGKKPVLRGAAGHFPRGAFVGVLGLNGAGKTTLFNILGNADREFAGEVSLRGGDVAYMRTESAFPAYMRVSELLAFYARFYPFDAEGAKERLAKAGVPVKSRLSALSSGKRRVAEFILNFSTRSPVLLLDEPLTNLDLNARDLVINALIDCSLDSRVVAVATHEISEFENLFTHVTVLKDGVLSKLEYAENIREKGMSVSEYYREMVL